MNASAGPASQEVVLYRTQYCGFCVMAARLLSSLHISFREVDVSGNRELRRWLVEATGQLTVPQIFVGQRSIGGYRELSALLRHGAQALHALTAETPPT
jgi:glutaredoxin 3